MTLERLSEIINTHWKLGSIIIGSLALFFELGVIYGTYKKDNEILNLKMDYTKELIMQKENKNVSASNQPIVLYVNDSILKK